MLKLAAALLLLCASAVCAAQSPMVQNQKVEGLYYLDGLAGVKFASLPSQCRANKQGWIISFDMDATSAWDVFNSAYVKGARVWAALSVDSQGYCNGVWAVSTHKLELNVISQHEESMKKIPEVPGSSDDGKP